ncbi:MAG: PQQ-binding-like beta-propeller repeat protein [Anaerolineae bacterium]
MNRGWIQRWLIVLAMLAALLLATSGCAGGVRASSWTGLTVVGDTLYAADLQQARAMDAGNGETLWTFPRNPQDNNQGLFYATPAVSDAGRVFFASQISTGGFLSQRQSIVWALDAENGEELWRFEGASEMYVEGGALGDGIFVIGNSDGKVYALDVESGSLQWTFETDHHVWATPLIVSDTVYVGSMDRHLYALDLNTGEVKWAFQRKGAFASTPALKDGTLYIGAFNDAFYAIDAEDGTERWHFEGEDWFWGSPVIQEDTVYAVDVKGRVYAFDAESGEARLLKSLVTDRGQSVAVRAGPAVSGDGGQLFVAAESGTLYALDAVDGFVDWSRAAEGQGLSKPVVSGSIVYQSLILGNPRVRALQVDEGREAWSFPPPGEES